MAKKNSTARINEKRVLLGAESDKPKPLTSKETLGAVLTAIRQHEPEEQNEIMQGLIKELGIDRLNKMRSTQQESRRHQECLEIFVKSTLSVEMILKEHENQNAQLRQQ